MLPAFTRPRPAAAAAAACLLFAVAMPALGQPIETPRLRVWADASSGTSVAWVLRGQPTPSGWIPGLIAACVPGQGPELAVSFGTFPGRHRPVQFAVRTPAGAVERHGPVLTAGPESGFHDPHLSDRADVLRMAAAALRTGSLVSNGFNSFWNDASAADNRSVLAVLERCR